MMPGTMRLLAPLMLVVAILTPALSAAQSPPKLKTPVAPKVEQLDSNACAKPSTQAIIGQGGDVIVRGRNDLSEQLARAEGVICPPSHIDPEIKAPTPPGGPMPVIPPPGSPGTDPTIRPK